MGQQVDVEVNRILTDEGSIFELSMTADFPEDADLNKPIKVTARFNRETMSEFSRLIEGMLVDSSLEFFDEIRSIVE